MPAARFGLVRHINSLNPTRLSLPLIKVVAYAQVEYYRRRAG
jgi:hypothetical protein